ncbi:MAG TPA: nitrite reductase small subunit NirD [Usitatibacter sp.]|nr:nitrite reductase small subunit NirD [Usitatibacter sp.]
MKIAVCRLDDIPRLGARRYRAEDGRTIALFRTEKDEVFALHDRCPHKGGPLSQGIVFGQSVSCPLHGWCIDLRKGEACAPDAGTVERFEVAVEDGMVMLDARAAAKTRKMPA